MSLLAGHQVEVLDTETTGLNPDEGHALVEIARVSVMDGVIGPTWSSLVRPGRPIPPEATAVHGITDAMVAEAASVAEVAERVRRDCEDRTLVFHHAAFDLPFLMVIYFAFSRRNPSMGLVLGLVVGVTQDLPERYRTRMRNVEMREPLRDVPRNPTGGYRRREVV